MTHFDETREGLGAASSGTAKDAADAKMDQDDPDDEDPDADDAPLREDEYAEERWRREEDEPATDDCPRCGAEMLSDWASCPKCGEYVVAGNGPRLRPWMVVAFLLALWGMLRVAGVL